MTTNTAYLALGSNIDDRRENMRNAIKQIAGHASNRIVRASSIYSTKPVGVEDQPDFLNAVIAIETTLSPTELLLFCQDVEKKLGRKRTFKWGPRVIDIDILLYDDVAVQDENLFIPHPYMMERAFVLIPLAEIAPDLDLPGDIKAFDAAGKINCDGIEIFEQGAWFE